MEDTSRPGRADRSQPGDLPPRLAGAGRGRRGLRRAIIAKLTYAVGKDPVVATERDWFVATALAVRDRMVDRWMTSTRATYVDGRKRVNYLSLEFLIGRLLFDALHNLQLMELLCAALAELGVDLDRLRRRRARRGVGQWRSRAPGGLFHGQHGDPVGGRVRLRHPLQSRPVPPGDQRWLAARISGAGCRSAILGSLSGPASATTPVLAAPWSGRIRPTGRFGISATRRRWSKRSPMTRPWWAGAGGTSACTLRTCGQHVLRTRCGWIPSTVATMSARWPRGPAPMRFPVVQVLYPSDDTPAGPGVAAAPGVFLFGGVAA